MPFNLSVIDKLLKKNDLSKSNRSVDFDRKKSKSIKNIKNDKKPEINLVKKTAKQKPQKDMNASLFRFINEKLSSMTSQEAYQFFKDDPSAFQTYHQGFSNQRVKWPEDPMNWIISRIKTLDNLKSLSVADFGCGDANLNNKIATKVKKIYNFDLVASNDSVVSCDIANVPLENESVDVVVISLALMGTNSNEYIAEANRILKKLGSLIIVELISRMKSPNFFINKVKKMGFEKLSTNVDKEKNENAYFLKIHLRKISDCDRTKLPDLELKQVLYKKR